MCLNEDGIFKGNMVWRLRKKNNIMIIPFKYIIYDSWTRKISTIGF